MGIKRRKSCKWRSKKTHISIAATRYRFTKKSIFGSEQRALNMRQYRLHGSRRLVRPYPVTLKMRFRQSMPSNWAATYLLAQSDSMFIQETRDTSGFTRRVRQVMTSKDTMYLQPIQRPMPVWPFLPPRPGSWCSSRNIRLIGVLQKHEER